MKILRVRRTRTLEDYFDFFEESNLGSNAFMVSTILDSSKIESLKTLHMNLSCSSSQKCLISAAIFVSNLEDLCYSIDTLRDIVRGGNIVISIVIRNVFWTSDWFMHLRRSDWPFENVSKKKLFSNVDFQ